MEAIEELAELSESMRQASAVLADEDVDGKSSSSSKRPSTFLNVVSLGNVVSSAIRICIFFPYSRLMVVGSAGVIELWMRSNSLASEGTVCYNVIFMGCRLIGSSANAGVLSIFEIHVACNVVTFSLCDVEVIK